VELKPISPTAKGSAQTFTGDVYVTPIYRGEEPSRMIVSLVRFTPARTNWQHHHAVGQPLHVPTGLDLWAPAMASSSAWSYSPRLWWRPARGNQRRQFVVPPAVCTSRRHAV
jgi:hypothetical protein